MIPPEFLQLLLSRVDIVDVISPHVELKKGGANLMGLCPFHGEKSPSFSVSPTKQFYHCFGCGAHGDALKFLLEYQGLGFVDGVKDLARRVGLEVPNDTRSASEREQAQASKARRQGLTEILRQAADFYAQQLRQSDPAIAYLKRRGLSGSIAAEFRLGYAPAGWRSLARCFAEYANPDLESAGLVIAHEDPEAGETKRYDRFRERVMFPIRNVVGEVIGFGGRVIDKGEPKYLNSPETPVFSKGQELYGLFEGRAAIRTRGHALVVEGYMDVVALAQHGIRQAVATLGTACTSEHVQKLFRFTDHIVFSFDGDAAGRRAAARALQSALPHLNERRSVRFLFLPAEHDPDSFVRAHGAEAFDAQIDASLPLSQHLLAVASESCRLDTPEGRSRLLAQGRPLWELLPDGVYKRQMLGEFAKLARLPEAELQSSWESTRQGQRGRGHVRADSASTGDTDERPQPYDAPDADTGHRPPRPARHTEASRSGHAPQHAGSRTGWRAQQPPRRASASPLNPPRPADLAVRLLLFHASWWEQLSAEQHHQLVGLPSPHGPLMAWLDRFVAEHGPLHWPSLRSAALSEAPELFPDDGLLSLPALDAAPAQESSLQDLQRLLLLLGDRDELSRLLGRDSLLFRPLREDPPSKV